MASYHCSVKNISRGSGGSSVSKAAYNSRDKLKDERIDQSFDYSKRNDLWHSEILSPSNAPEWMNDRGKLWNAVENIEV